MARRDLLCPPRTKKKTKITMAMLWSQLQESNERLKEVQNTVDFLHTVIEKQFNIDYESLGLTSNESLPTGKGKDPAPRHLALVRPMPPKDKK